MTNANKWKIGGAIAAVVVIVLLLLRKGATAGASEIKLGDVILPPVEKPGPFTFPNFDWASLALPDYPALGNLPGYSPASCGCGCDERQVAFDDAWLDAISEGITNAFRDEFSSFNYILPQTVQTLIATGGVRAYNVGGPY